jgi:integrase
VLSDSGITRAKPRPAAYRLPDGYGLTLLVSRAGSKLWRWKYRFEGAQKEMTFGAWPDVPLVRARELHADARRLLASGIDPMAQRKADKATRATSDANSFRMVASLWLAHWGVNKSPRHVDTTRRRLETNVFPHLGSRPIADIEAPDLVRMVKAIEARGVGDLAKRALETCGQIFRYGIAHGHCKRNPAADIKPRDVLRPTVKRNMARVSEAELPGLLRAIEVYQGAPLTRLALKFMTLVFVRTSELTGAEWPEFDFNRARWVIPAERMKMRAPHVVPLPTQALEVLELLRIISGSGRFVFPGDRGQPTMSDWTILMALRRMGYGGKQTGHGFRGIASTILHEQGFPHDHIELQLAHAPRDAVSGAYNHALYLEPRARMMQWWGDYLERRLRDPQK